MKVISEQEVQNRRRSAQAKPDNFANEVVTEPIENNIVENIVINLETEGRFDTPSTITLRQFKGRDVNDLVLSRQEKILNNLVQVLNNCIIPEGSFRIEDMLTHEFMELMIGEKAKISTQHVHKWICDCQASIPVSEQLVNDAVIDLSTIKYVNITEADEKLREYTKPYFDSMSDDEFKSYKVTTYNGEKTPEEIEAITKEEALALIKIKEPIRLKTDKHTYEFRFNRVGDLVFAQKEAERAFTFKFSQHQKKQWKESLGIGMQEFMLQKDQELEELKELQGKYAISIYQSLKLMKVDGQEITSLKEKMRLYDDIDSNYLMQFNNYIDELRFGIYDKRDFVCPICGETKQRVLQREFSPLDFIPLLDATSRERRYDPKCIISFGI